MTPARVGQAMRVVGAYACHHQKRKEKRVQKEELEAKSDYSDAGDDARDGDDGADEDWRERSSSAHPESVWMTEQRFSRTTYKHETHTNLSIYIIICLSACVPIYYLSIYLA